MSVPQPSRHEGAAVCSGCCGPGEERACGQHEELRRLAEDLIPGARARLWAVAGEDPLLRRAAEDGQAEADGAGGYRAVIRLASGVLLAVEAVARPDVAVLERLTRLKRLGPARACDDAVRDAFVQLVRSLPTRAMVLDTDLKIVAASPLTTGEMGLPEAEFLGRTPFDVRPDVFGPFRKAYERVLAGQNLQTSRLRSPVAGVGELWFQTELHPWRDGHGHIMGVISMALEVTELVQSIQRHERSEERLNVALQIADLHVWELDFATKTMTRAGVGESFFDGSFTDEQIVADTMITIHPEDRARIGRAWTKAMLEDQPFQPEYRINRQDGKEVWAACTTKLIRDEAGAPARLIGAMQNITDRKRAEAALVQAKEEAESANRAKSVFLATMSHEIRTPLNGVLGMAQAMAADVLTSEQRARLETVRQSGEALLVILNDLLDLSKIEAGKLELEVADFGLCRLLDGVKAAYADLAARKGLTFALEAEAEACGLYRGDSTRLRQILFNLVSNSLKFTETGEVRLTVARRGDVVDFSVCDTGIGIPADRLPRLFNKFEQADASTTRRFGGSGLGLAISRDLARLMGGDIQVESEEGRGSVFRLSLPMMRVADEDPFGAPDAQAVTFAPSGPVRLLAAEDNSVNQTVLRTLLQQVGVEPVIVEDGAAAVAAWRAQDWDVILMDVQMPGMDGPAATRAIRAAEQASGRARTPIVALTANAMSHQVAEYAAAGMDGFIAKPIRVEELFAVLQAALGEVGDSAVA